MYHIVIAATASLAVVVTSPHAANAGQPPRSTTYTQLYAFGDGSDGAFPYSVPVQVGGVLYGTTYNGGSTFDCCGTVFAVDLKSGLESTPHQFQGGTDGAMPGAGLIYAKGLLYGTTIYGGGGNANNCTDAGCGTVFSLDPTTGEAHVLYAFRGGSDGSEPYASLVLVDGKLWGTTAYGGDFSGDGTVFSIDLATGKEKVVHVFQGSPADGSYPIAGLLNVNGVLYGTTDGGGANAVGAVFSLDVRSNKEVMLYSFNPSVGTHDGWAPHAGLTSFEGALYGTTFSGGTNGGGTIFSINPVAGIERVVFSFGKGENGFKPEAGLTVVRNTLYGTTYNGGSGGVGTVFALNPASGKERVVFSFNLSNGGGGGPTSGLLHADGKFYGVTVLGGNSSCGCGVVYSLKP